jgi:hypothetical protein
MKNIRNRSNDPFYLIFNNKILMIEQDYSLFFLSFNESWTYQTKKDKIIFLFKSQHESMNITSLSIKINMRECFARKENDE